MSAGETVELDAIRALYDRLSDTFLDCAGPTFQAGLVQRHDGREDPAWSNRELGRRAGVQDGERILDAGCGVAGPACDLAEQLPALEVDGITLSPVQVKLARAQVARRGLEGRVRVHEGDYHRLPFGDASFDRVLFLESAEYSPRPAALFGEAARVLKPGGTLLLKGALRIDGPLTAQQEADRSVYDAMWAIERTPSRAELVAAMEIAGLRIEAVDWLELGSSHFIGAMFEVGAQGLVPNAFGEALFRRFVDLPVRFAQILASRW